MLFVANYSVDAMINLKSFDESVARRIVHKIAEYCLADDPMVFAKHLTGSLKGCYRFRIGDYRAVFQKKPRGRIIVCEILYIQHRKDAYTD